MNEVMDPTTLKLVSLVTSTALRSLTFVELDEFVDAYKGIFRTSFKPKNESERWPLAGSSKEAAKVRENLHEFVTNRAKEEIEATIEAERLDEKFQELDKMKVEFQHLPVSKKAWLAPGDANQHMKPFDKASNVEKRNQLIRQVRIERDRLNILRTRVENKRKKVLHLKEAIENNVAELNKEVLQSVEALSLE